jgi:hypothetical protein
MAEHIVKESSIPNPVKEEVSMEDEQSFKGDTTHNFDQRSSVHSLLSAMQSEPRELKEMPNDTSLYHADDDDDEKAMKE